MLLDQDSAKLGHYGNDARVAIFGFCCQQADRVIQEIDLTLPTTELD